jgi:DNA-directed RNA polymerase specialized sigma24 family protein
MSKNGRENEEDRDHAASETKTFQSCRKHDGSIEPVNLIGRNGIQVPQFHPSVTEPAEKPREEESAEYLELVEEVCHNLTPIQRATWLKLIDGRSILDIAAEERIARAAIYDRIHRMVGRNSYCALWWRIKRKKNQHA